MQLDAEQVVLAMPAPDGQSAQVDPHWRYPDVQLAITQLDPEQVVLATPAPDGQSAHVDPH